MDDTPDGGGPAQPAPAKSRRERGIFERPKGSGVWWVRYHDQYGREHREKIGKAKSLALEVYQERKTDIRRGKYRAEKPRDVLLRDFLPTFLKGRVKRNPCTGALENVLKDMQHAALWTAALGKLSLRQIKPGDIRRQIHRRQEAGMAPATINRELAFLRRAFTVAIEDELAEKNPIGKGGVKLARENNRRVRYLSDDEEQQLRHALGDEEWPKVAVALHTGLRRSNVFQLRWDADVNFDAGTIRAREPKGGQDYHVPMNDELRALLRALPSRLRRSWVFPSETGETPLNSQNFINRVFRPALRAAKIRDFSWHDLRHTFASRLAMAGVDIRTIQELLGHRTLAMTLRYAHLSPTHKRDAVSRLVRPQSGAPTGTRTGTDPETASESATAAADTTSRNTKRIRIWRRAGSNGRPRDYETLALAN
jgi:site-specific recombinase XerD